MEEPKDIDIEGAHPLGSHVPWMDGFKGKTLEVTESVPSRGGSPVLPPSIPRLGPRARFARQLGPAAEAAAAKQKLSLVSKPRAAELSGPGTQQKH